ncbi:hypothetical protein K2Z84_31115 [Candidatus Binatia bacterium]|nr:hypothetical protein [Candidatus Binatia bacterium]
MKTPFAGRKAIFLAALFSGVVTARCAGAATLVSPTVITRFGQDYVACIIVNADTKDITVNVELLDFEGALLKQSYIDLAPGRVRDVNLGSVYGGYCRFTGKFTAKKVRASANVIDSEGHNIAIAPAE